MITLKDVENVKLQNIKVRLSDSLYDCSSLPEDYKIETKDVWLFGPLMGDWFVKTDRNDTQLYPLYRDYITWDELKDLEVLEVHQE